MEKSGTIVLTEEEVKSIQAGIIPLRVQEWRLSLEELQAIIAARQHQLVNSDRFDQY